MKSAKTEEKRNIIEKEAEYIVRYVKGFEVFSARDEAAMSEILTAMNNLHAKIDSIEESHQKRIILMKEMAKTVNAMEEDHKQFASKHKKSSA